MFETLFTCPGALRRHQESPLAAERAAYLSDLAAQGMARGTILRRSSYCLCVAVELERWPPDRCFDEAEVDRLAEEWAARRPASGRSSSPELLMWVPATLAHRPARCEQQLALQGAEGWRRARINARKYCARGRTSNLNAPD